MRSTIVAPTCPLPPCNLSVADVEAVRPALAGYVAQFASAFARADQHTWAHRYLQGLVRILPRTSIEPMALAFGFSIRGMQAFVGESPWACAPLLVQHERLVAQTLADQEDVFLVDESGLPKQGQHSAGVSRQ